MRILCTEQKTAEWFSARTGIITASRMVDVMNFLKETKDDKDKGIRREGAERRKYRTELVAERLTSIPAEHYVTKYMDFGEEYEAEARRAYELGTEQMVDQSGFALHPTLDFLGSSPDGLLPGGGVEIKVPKATTHIDYIFADIVPVEYQPQMFTNMVCWERDWWDFFSYRPDLPGRLGGFIKRLYRDEQRIREIEEAATKFNEEIEATIERLRKNVGDFKLPAAQESKVHRELRESVGEPDDFTGEGYAFIDQIDMTP